MDKLMARCMELEKLVENHDVQQENWEKIIHTHQVLNEDLTRECKILENTNLKQKF
jgi:hypothetical protein